MTLVATTTQRSTQWVMRGHLLDEQLSLPPGVACIRLERGGKVLAEAQPNQQGEFQLRWNAGSQSREGVRLHVLALGYGESFRSVRTNAKPQSHRIGALNAQFEVRVR